MLITRITLRVISGYVTLIYIIIIVLNQLRKDQEWSYKWVVSKQATNNEQRATNNEQQATNNEQRTTNNEQRTSIK